MDKLDFSSHQTRKKTDLQYEMLFNYYTVESPRNYRHVIMDEEPFVEYVRNDFILST